MSRKRILIIGFLNRGEKLMGEDCGSCNVEDCPSRKRPQTQPESEPVKPPAKEEKPNVTE
jgi:hypothetical protein